MNEDWNVPQPLHAPSPTYMPAVVAFGSVAALFGLINSPALTVIGCIILFAGAAGWARELWNER